METYDIYFRDEQDSANKGFNLKDKEKAIRMAEDMLAEKKGYVKDFPGGIISVIDKSTKEEVWSKPIGRYILGTEYTNFIKREPVASVPGITYY